MIEARPAGRADARESIQPLWDAVDKAGEAYISARAAYFERAPWTDKKPFNELDISPRVLNTLETARELATCSRTRRGEAVKDVQVAPLHLAGAVVSTRVDAGKEIAELGLSVADLRKALLIHARDAEERVDVWSELLGDEKTILTGRPVALSDEPEACVRLTRSGSTIRW